MNFTQLNKYRTPNPSTHQINIDAPHPQAMRVGKYAGIPFSELISEPRHLNYVKYVCHSKNDKSTKVFLEDKHALISFITAKAEELGLPTKATLNDRLFCVLKDNYLDGFTFPFSKKHAGKSLRQVIIEDRPYVLWYISTTAQHDDADPFWGTDKGLDTLCIVHALETLE